MKERVAENLAKRSFGEIKGKLRSERSHCGGQRMRILRSVGWFTFLSLLSVAALAVLFHDTPSVSAQTGTPPSSTISSTSGSASWDFAPVGGGTVTNVGILGICPPGMCDDNTLTVVLPAPAAPFCPPIPAKLPI